MSILQNNTQYYVNKPDCVARSPEYQKLLRTVGELIEKVRRLEAEIEEMHYKPPGVGGKYYEGAKTEFEGAKEGTGEHSGEGVRQ